MNEQLVAVAIAELPALIAFLRDAFTKKNPDAAEPTEEEIRAAFDAAFSSSVAKDDQWLAAHPEQP